MTYLSDAEYEEEVRCAAHGLEGPNVKEYRRVTADAALNAADEWRTRAKENGWRNPYVASFFCTTCHWSENAHPRAECSTGFVPGKADEVSRHNREIGFDF